MKQRSYVWPEARMTGSLMISDEIGQRNCSGTAASEAPLLPSPPARSLRRPSSEFLSLASASAASSKASASALPAATAATSRLSLRRSATASSAVATGVGFAILPTPPGSIANNAARPRGHGRGREGRRRAWARPPRRGDEEERERGGEG
uniref:Uncharacterized protein n=1 Tax=Arundo donax TaxID=35708 RepID=A0A0A9EYM0_ARUDO